MSQNAETDASAAPRPGTTHPHLARERALKVLFAADVRQVDPRVLLDEVATRPADLELLDELEPDQEQVADDEELQVELTRRRRLPLDDYTRTLVRGVAERQRAIDELLDEVADRWQVQRMPAVDRNLLRMAVYELAEQDTPNPVVIDEAVSLAIAFAGEKARGFVNGVLETVRKRVVAGEVELQLSPEPEEDLPAEAPVAADGEAATEEDTTEELTTTSLDEVDEAASAAYDLALDLLNAEGPLEETPTEDDEEQPHDADAAWTTDLDEPAADEFSLDDLDHLDHLDDLERIGDVDEDAVADRTAREPANDDAVSENGEPGADADDGDDDAFSDLRDEGEALW